MKAIIVFLLLAVVGISCFSTKEHLHPVPAIFANTRWTLLYGKLQDTVVNFCLSPENCYEITFRAERFRSFEGRFDISGTSKDTASKYHTSVPYTGFYNVDAGNKISLYWFSMITWAMDFRKHKMGREIGSVFAFEGMYDDHNSNLVFYKEDTGKMKKDTIIVMKFIRKEP